jgi:hypothetical protein
LLVIFWIEFNRWISSNLNSLDIVGCSVNLGNYEIINIFIGLSKLIPNWLELFAVAAPWGIELNKYILGLVFHNLFEGFSYNYSNRSFIILWNRLRF